MSGSNKVVKFKKRKTINIGIIVFLILFVYIAFNVIIYFTKEKLSIYEVHEGTTVIDNHFTGLIVRDEKVYTSHQAGFITYFQKEGARVAKNSDIYSVDEVGQLNQLMSDEDIAITMPERSKAEIKRNIRDFDKTFSDTNYAKVYDFKEDAQSTVLDILNTAVVTHGIDLLEESGITFNYDLIQSTESGVISYYLDSLETITPQTVTAEMFDTQKYNRISLRKTEMQPQDTPIYKIVTSDTWKLILPLTQIQYEKLDGRVNVNLTVLEDDFQMKAALSLYKIENNYYAELTMDKYLSNYLEERYLDVEVDFDSDKGLKIPLTSVVEKDVTLVPKEYMGQGANSEDEGLTIKNLRENGEIIYTFQKIDVLFEDDVYLYLDKNVFPVGTIIMSTSTPNDEYTITEVRQLTGVYNVNLGYAVFKRIDIISKTEDYCIIDKNTKNGLSAYDQIALVGSTAVEQAIIY